MLLNMLVFCGNDINQLCCKKQLQLLYPGFYCEDTFFQVYFLVGASSELYSDYLSMPLQQMGLSPGRAFQVITRLKPLD